jgi:hypothetical protein
MALFSRRIARLVLAILVAAAAAASAQPPLRPKLTDVGVTDPASAGIMGELPVAKSTSFGHAALRAKPVLQA